MLKSLNVSSKFNLIKFLKLITIVVMPVLHAVFFFSLAYQNNISKFLNVKYVYFSVIFCLVALPIFFAKTIFKSVRSQIEFVTISYITSFSLCIAFFQINTRSDIATSIPALDQLGFNINWGSQLGMIMLSVVAIGIFYDLLFGRYVSDFRLSFTSTFVLQLILSLGFISYIHLINIGKFDERFYKVAWLDVIINIPYWLLTLIFAITSSFLTIFYFGRGNVLHHARSFWAKIGWRLLIILIHLELVTLVMIFPQNYWWKVLFYILIWDFIAVPLARVYKQSTNYFWDRLKVSLVYHLILFVIVFWVSHK